MRKALSSTVCAVTLPLISSIGLAAPISQSRMVIPAHGLDIEFSSRGLSAIPQGASTPLSLSLSSVVCGNQRLELDQSAAVEQIDHDRVNIRHPIGASNLPNPSIVVDEWFQRSPQGLEQGFTIPALPCAQSGKIYLELAIGAAWTASWLEPGKTVKFSDSEQHSLRYGGLHVVDARGEVAPSNIELHAGVVRLAIDTSAATFPIYVDPILANLTQTLTTNDGSTGDLFGTVVAISGDTIAVGAPQDAHDGTAFGAVYLYSLQNGTWIQTQKLVPPDGLGSDNFGGALALEGDSLAVAAYSQYDLVHAFPHGAVYVYTRNGTSWTQQAKIVASNPSPSMWFGVGLSLSGDTLVVGAPGSGEKAVDGGAAYVYNRTGSTWTEQAKILPADIQQEDYFGLAMAVSGDQLMAGSASADFGTASGAVYVYTRSGSTWTLNNKLLASDGSANGRYGQSIALRGNQALIGAAHSNTQGGSLGAVYDVQLKQGAWLEQSIVLPPAPLANNGFGHAVAISGALAVVSEPSYSIPNNGVGYVGGFSSFAHGTSWGNGTREVAPGDNASYAACGDTIAIDGTTVVLSCRNNRALVYSLSLGNGAPCTDSSQCTSSFCTSGVCCNTACGNGTDPCQACSVATGSPLDGTCVQLDPSTCSQGTGGTGGTGGSGGAGAAGAGGTSGTGTGGTAGIGGTSGSAGAGGTAGTGGSENQGGTGGTGTAGQGGTGAAAGSSGTQGTSGTSAEGGTSGTAGIAGTAGAGGTTGAQINPSLNASNSDDSGGCGCAVPGHDPAHGMWAACLGLATLVEARRRRSRSRVT